MNHKAMRFTMVAALGILALAACRSDSNDVATLRTTDDTQVEVPNADPAPIRDNEAMMMALTQCLRDQGIEVLDPVVDAEGNVQKPELAEGVEWDEETMGFAWEACAEHLEGFTFEEKRVDASEQVDQFVALAACLRDKGYDVDDPTAEMLEQWMGDFKMSINWDDPAAEADFGECSGDMFGESGGK